MCFVNVEIVLRLQLRTGPRLGLNAQSHWEREAVTNARQAAGAVAMAMLVLSPDAAEVAGDPDGSASIRNAGRPESGAFDRHARRPRGVREPHRY